MSVMQYSETLNSKDVQVWDNAAFDDGESKDSTAVNLSWSSLKPAYINLSQSLESCSSKENQTPSVEVLSPDSTESAVQKKPLRTNNIIKNAQRTPRSKAGISGRKISENANQICPVKENIPEERNIDSEIEDIEKEINLLSSRLESLRLEKARRTAKSMEKRGRIVAAKFKDLPRQGSKTCDEQTKIEESMGVSVKLKTPRRGLSMGPSEIMREARRGISLGPVEIYSATKLKQLVKQDITTPVQPTSSRRKSCYWKLHDIDELRMAKERGKSMSLSPKSRAKTASQVQVKQAATAIGSKKGVKKEEGVISSIQPKKLFAKDGEKSAPGKKPLKSGRVVASRYNQIPNGGISATKELRKRSLPENEDDSRRFDRKRVSLTGKFQGAGQPGVEKTPNKQLDMPSDVAMQKNLEHRTPLSVSKLLARVPTVKTFRYMDDSPRDSGPAKRASEMAGRKSCFSMENVDYEEVKEFICHGMHVAEQEVTREYRYNDNSPQDLGAAKKVSQLVGRKPFLNHDDDDEIPVFSFEEEDGEN